jgi:hypothetical protein
MVVGVVAAISGGNGGSGSVMLVDEGSDVQLLSVTVIMEYNPAERPVISMFPDRSAVRVKGP